MEFDFVTNIKNCYVDIPVLLYYSHISTALVALTLSFFVFLKNKKLLTANILLFMAIFFSFWSVMDIILWVVYDSRKIMFFWSIINIFELLVSVSTLYFAYAFLEKKDVSLKIKFFIALLLTPFILLISTRYNLPQFIVDSCEANQGQLLNYFYFLEAFFSLWLVIYLVAKIIKNGGFEKKQTIFFSIGIILFSSSFSWVNIIGSITDNWEILQYGLFGMPLFLGFLAYLIVKYEAFNIRLIGSQALVATLIILIGSELFFVDSTVNIILVLITLGLSLGFGYMLIRSIGSEVKRKDELQDMADRLAQANDQLRKLDNAKTEFISIASHQLRTPLTSIKGFISLVIEGSYGQVSDSVRDALTKVYASSERLIKLVEDLLNVSRIESGRMQFVFDKASIEDLVKELYDNFILVAKNKKLYLDLKIPKEKMTEVVMDSSKIHEVVSNLIDNALKYTERGGVIIKAEEIGDMAIRITVSDTGIGVPAEEIQNLFKKFSRGKDTGRLHVGGTGLGLYVGKNIIDAHHGRIWVESDGEGRGSSFIIELPINQLI